MMLIPDAASTQNKIFIIEGINTQLFKKFKRLGVYLSDASVAK
jgi:hypothetical protein